MLHTLQQVVEATLQANATLEQSVMRLLFVCLLASLAR
jgi:hypothetical protein